MTALRISRLLGKRNTPRINPSCHAIPDLSQHGGLHQIIMEAVEPGVENCPGHVRLPHPDRVIRRELSRDDEQEISVESPWLVGTQDVVVIERDPFEERKFLFGK